MATWSAEGAYCIGLDENNQIITPFKQYSVDDIKELQLDSVIKVVIPSTQATIHTLELPWLGERKSREAIPFALEEQLSQPVSSVHMAFSKAFYQQGHYLVVVVDKQRCMDWIATLHHHGIYFTDMLLDWFALNPHEALITDAGLLVYADDFKGELGASLAKQYLASHPQQEGIRCRDSHLDLQLAQEKTVKERVGQWIAKRLNKANAINLCQGELTVTTYSAWANSRWVWVLGAFSAWVCSVLLMNGVYWLQLHHAYTRVNTQITTLYQRFFPNERNVVNPKFRIEQLLKTNASTQQRVFWFLLNSLSKVIKQERQAIVEQVTYHDHILVVTLNCHDFAMLERLENALKRESINVVQVSAASSEHDVTAVLELSE
jgi:general secretion pathway protein L